MQNFKSKAIYQPKGKAGEYAEWACNFYVGCSNGCTYCYLKKGRGAKILGGSVPTLKKCFDNESHAIEIFEKELLENIDEIRKHGLFFTFTSDPCLPETWLITCEAINICRKYDVSFKILTKRIDWHIDEFIQEFKINGTIWNREPKQHLWAFGFTLTGHDELEPNASTNAERIEAMRKLHNAGFKTFASIEPIINFDDSFKIIEETRHFCDLFLIGLESGGKYNLNKAKEFYAKTNIWLSCNGIAKAYWKQSFRKLLGLTKEMAEDYHHCQVGKKFNLFGNGNE